MFEWFMVSESLMLAKKTVKAKILELRKDKEELLKREYGKCSKLFAWR